MLSVLIHTLNEEVDLPGCLESLSWCDDIWVYDSLSTDRTQYIAKEAGVRLIHRPHQDISVSFGGDEASHRNWGLTNIPFLHPWLLVIDADERLPIDTFSEISSILSSPPPFSQPYMPSWPVAFQLRRRDFYRQRHLRHVQATPWYIRLFRPEFVHYERLINPITVVKGPVGSLQGYIDHYPFSKGLSHWISRHNTYSTLEARQLYNLPPLFSKSNLCAAFLSPHFHQRRAHQKSLFMSLPARPLLKFILLYFVKRGFLDGHPGLIYALLQSIYELFIDLKVQELKRGNDFMHHLSTLSSSKDKTLFSN